MKQQQTKGNNKANGFTRNSFKFISSCIKTVSSGVRSASASVAASISSDSQDLKDQVLWACFDWLELGPSSFKRVLLLGYTNGFQVFDVDDASSVSELVSRRDDPCTFLQIQPLPAKSEGCEGFRASHPLLLVAAGDETNGPDPTQRRRDGSARDEFTDLRGKIVKSPTAVRFYSLRSHNYVHVLRFRSAVYTVRCSPHIVAVGLSSQVYCFDALTLENKFSVLTYPVPQMVGPGMAGINIGYGPMDVGPRWLAYASNNQLLTNTGRLSPQTASPGISPSTSPSSGSLVARYAVESSKQLLDLGYKTLSKYCHELLPDGSSSPVTSNSGWKVSKNSAASPDMDTAGMVIVKDFVSRAVIAHFRAHTSPISALCFDPSGTLLVTASIHGNNINIFRIMPSSSQNGTGSQSYNWTSSHAHLYKLHRGITSAVIQDICFSQYSQWVAIVSSKGTCHIYVLSPFGGESGLQVQNSPVEGPTLVPILSSPWWSTSSCAVNQQSFSSLPPNPVTLSVVSRIRTGTSGWLNTVSNAATSAAGMASMPSCAVSAVFHCSMPNALQPGRSKRNTLEHLLVYSPSGHLIQYELLPAMGVETTNTSSRTGSSSLVQPQDEDLRVKAEPVQWWDVCRRADWPEREECLKGLTFGRKDRLESGLMVESLDCEDNDSVGKGGETHERSTLYLSKAEVQMNNGRIPTWHNAKIHFFAMNPILPAGMKSVNDDLGGEIEIEKIPYLEIEIKRKDLLPVFEQFHKVKPEWNRRVLVGERYPTSSSNASGAEERSSPDISDVYPQPVQHSQFGSSIAAGQMVSYVKNGAIVSSTFPSSLLTKNSLKTDNSSMEISPPEKSCLINTPSPLKDASLLAERAIPKEGQSSNSVGSSGVSNVSSNCSDFSMNIVDEGSTQDPLGFGGYFQEEYCKGAPLDESHEMSEAVTDVDSSSSPRVKEKPEEDGEEEEDEMLGGIFAFSEEG